MLSCTGEVYVSRNTKLYARYPNLVTADKITSKMPEENRKKRVSSKRRYRTDEIPVYLEALNKIDDYVRSVCNIDMEQLYTPNPLQVSSTTASSWAENKFQFEQLPLDVDVSVPQERKKRKREQVTNMMTFVIPFLFDGCIVCDFASGSGHQSIPLAYHFPNCKFILVDMKARSLQIVKERTTRLNLTNISFVHDRIENFHGKFDVGISLHACGAATDLALLKCIRQSAAYVTCPCCIGKVVLKNDRYKNNVQTCEKDRVHYPRSVIFNAALKKEEYNKLAKAADFGHGGTDKTNIGKDMPYRRRAEESNFATRVDTSRRKCKSMIELDRQLFAQSHGYKTWIFTLFPKSCTPKNDLLIGACNPQAIERFKKFLI